MSAWLSQLSGQIYPPEDVQKPGQSVHEGADSTSEVFIEVEGISLEGVHFVFHWGEMTEGHGKDSHEGRKSLETLDTD